MKMDYIINMFKEKFDKIIKFKKIIFTILFVFNILYPICYREFLMIITASYIGYFVFSLYLFLLITFPLMIYSYMSKCRDFKNNNDYIVAFAGFENYILIINDNVVDTKSTLFKDKNIVLKGDSGEYSYEVVITPKYKFSFICNKKNEDMTNYA